MPVSNQKVAVYLEVKNSKENRLGLPLPKGKIRVYKADGSGSQQFIGEDWIDHTPKDERVKIKLGNAFDLVGERTQKDFRKIASDLYEVEWEISAPQPQDASRRRSPSSSPCPATGRSSTSSHQYEKIQAHTLKYQIPVPKDGAAKLVYRVRLRF